MKPNRCCLLGNDNITLRCGDLLLAEDFEIVSVISIFPPARAWAEKNKLSFVEHFSNLSKTILPSFDYLFCIINNKILPEWLITLPKHIAINYHDSLLPQ